MRRFLSAAPKHQGARLEASFARVLQSHSGQLAVKAYGECLERQSEDIRKDCCRVEFDTLQAEYERAGLIPARNRGVDGGASRAGGKEEPTR